MYEGATVGDNAKVGTGNHIKGTVAPGAELGAGVTVHPGATAQGKVSSGSQVKA